MRDASENTVAAVNQLKESSRVFYMGKATAKSRLLVVGNSITRHGPKESIGWPNDWGMAASKKEKDFVHLLQNKLLADGLDVLTMVSQCSCWEVGLQDTDILSKFEQERAFDADVILFRLGENVPKGTDMAHFAKCLRAFLTYICPNGRVVLTSTVWGNAPLNEELKKAAEELSACFVDIRGIGADESLMAIGKYEHKGVAMHPGDKGMEYIANAVYDSVKAAL